MKSGRVIDQGVEKLSVQRVTTQALHGVQNRKIRKWRQRVGWSANRLARELGVGRTYVKHLESKRRPWRLRPRIATRLAELMASTQPRVRLDPPKEIQVVTKYHLPPEVYLFVRPRRCRGHGRMSVMASNQVYCGTTAKERAECRRLWRRRERKKQKED